MANISHLFSALVLHRLALELPLCKKSIRPQFAFATAALHILSPAGLFLSAPYAEALFSLLNILGVFLYVYSYPTKDLTRHSLKDDLCLVSSGLCFGLATTIRSNGLFSGSIFALDACIWFATLLDRTGIPILSVATLPSQLQSQIRSFQPRRLPATIVAGVLVGVGFLTPQYIAYQEYCSPASEDRQSWCLKYLPSISSWVQARYW